MSIRAFSLLSCPLDNEPLSCNEGAWTCNTGHSFDIARQGYINLLPVQHKRSKEPGDHQAMVTARQRFLNAGYYQPIADAVNHAVLTHCKSINPISCLDAGCGEGHYLRQLAADCHGKTLALLGVDISKRAILAAAKQDKRATWVVASNAHLPVQSATLDCVLCLFGFPVYSEFARTLKPGGLLLQVDAGPDHLRELREIIYPSLKAERATETPTPEGFERPSTHTIRYALSLDNNQAIADLLAMTPHLYRATAEGLSKAAALGEITITVDAKLNCFTRRQP